MNISLIPYNIYKQQNYIQEYNAAKNKMLNSLGNLTQSEAKKLQDILNAIYTSDKFNENVANNLLQRLSSYAESSIASSLRASERMKVTTKKLSEAWRNYYIKLDSFKKMNEEFVDIIGQENPELEVRSYLREALSLQGRVSKIQGDLFEAFLQFAVPIIQNTSSDTIDKTVDDLIQSINNAEKIKTLGNRNREEPIEFELNDRYYSIKSQGKTDVSVEAPLFNNKTLNISAKNYGKLRDIAMVTGASLAGMVSQWPTSDEAKSYYFNSLSVWETQTNILNIAHKILAIQAISGTSNKELKSNVLILNINSKGIKNPIRVISIPALLKQILELDEDLEQSFYVKYSPQIQWYNSQHPRESDDFDVKVETADLTMHLKSSKIRFSYLKTLI